MPRTRKEVDPTDFIAKYILEKGSMVAWKSWRDKMLHNNKTMPEQYKNLQDIPEEEVKILDYALEMVLRGFFDWCLDNLRIFRDGELIMTMEEWKRLSAQSRMSINLYDIKFGKLERENKELKRENKELKELCNGIK